MHKCKGLFTFATTCRYHTVNIIILKKREYKKYTLGGMSRLLVVLLAVFYISIIAMEAAHMHADVIETSASADAEDDPAANECKICAYFAHQQQAGAVISYDLSIALFSLHDRVLIARDFANAYQTSVQEFINRGPPCPFI